MGRHTRLRRLHRAGRFRAMVAEFAAADRLDSARRMTHVPWVADALAAVGRVGAADRFIRERLEDAHNPRLDPAPVARLQLARLRVAVRATRSEPDLARRLTWAARDWFESLPVAPAAVRSEFEVLGGLVDGLLAEGQGELDRALAHLSAAAARPVADPRLARRVRAVLDRCVARRDAALALDRRLAEIRVAEDPYAVQRWLARIIGRGPDETPLISALIDALYATATPDAPDAPTEAPRDRARRALRRLALPDDLELHRAIWRSALWRARDDREAALAALEPLGRAGADSRWALARQLGALDLRHPLNRQDAETLMRWWNHADGAVSMVARMLVARALRDAGDLPGALEASKAAVGRIRAAETAPMRWLLPAAWPGEPETLATHHGVVVALAAQDGPLRPWCQRVVGRVRRAVFVARALDLQD